MWRRYLLTCGRGDAVYISTAAGLMTLKKKKTITGMIQKTVAKTTFSRLSQKNSFKITVGPYKVCFVNECNEPYIII